MSAEEPRTIRAQKCSLSLGLVKFSDGLKASQPACYSPGEFSSYSHNRSTNLRVINNQIKEKQNIVEFKSWKTCFANLEVFNAPF